MRKHIVALLAGAMLILATATAMAIPISVGFHRITNNGPPNISSQLGLIIYDATDANTNYSTLSLTASQFLFAFSNNAVIASNVSEIYIDNRPNLTLLNIGSLLTNGTTFAVANNLSPRDLPGGNAIGFSADAALSADQGSGPNGINAITDYVAIIYNVTGGQSAIETALLTGDLRIGLHVRSIDGGTSDSYVNDGGAPVPEPGTMVLLGAGMLGLAIFSKRRMKA